MVITVQCTSCSTSFPVDTAKVPAEGVYARCSVCAGVFFVERPQEAPAGVGAGAAEPPTDGAAPPFQTDTYEVESRDTWEPSEGFDAGGSSVPVAAVEQAPDVFEAPIEPAFELGGTPEPSVHGGHGEALEIAEPVVDAPTAPTTFEIAAPPPAPPAPEAPAPAQTFSFGRRDPHEKARRLARVLVSDMIMYNPERHTRAIASGSLREDFEDEIKKSWQEFVDQVGEEMARSTPYFDEALNDILARGERIFP